MPIRNGNHNTEHVLGDLEAAYTEIKPYGLARDYYLEISSKIELFTIAAQLNSWLKPMKETAIKDIADQLVTVKQTLEELYKEYSPEVDQKLFEVTDGNVYQRSAGRICFYVCMNLRNPQDKKDEGTGLMEKMLYTESLLSNKEKLYTEYLSKDPKQAIDLINNDKAMRLYIDMISTYNTKLLQN